MVSSNIMQQIWFLVTGETTGRQDLCHDDLYLASMLNHSDVLSLQSALCLLSSRRGVYSDILLPSPCSVCARLCRIKCIDMMTFSANLYT